MIDRTAKAAIRAKMGITIPLRESRPSTTRSDALSGPLHAAGLGIDRLVQKLNQMIDATITVRVICRTEAGEYVDHREVTEPDWKTQLKAAEMLNQIHGYGYAPQKAQDQHPLVLILNQLPDEIRQPVEQSIENRLKTLLKPGVN